MPDHSDGCVPRTVRSRSVKGGRQGVGPVACGDAWHVPGRIHSSMATAKTYQSPPRCLRKCADQNVLASVVQQRHVSEQSLGAKCYRGKMHSVVRPDDSYKYLCSRCLALGGAATARGGAPQPVVQELRV